MDILIAGAGIGGLSTALALHSRGIHATLLESAAELRALGVGINLLPHAVRELHELGLGDELRAIAATPATIDFYTHDGTLLFREPRGIEGGYGYPQCSVHRGRLQMLLLAAVVDRLGPEAVRTGAAVAGFTESPDGVTVRTAIGDFGADILIGADGIHSTVRSRLHPGPDPMRWSGARMFRGAARMPAFLDARTMAIVKGPDGVELITYPIGGGLVNWVLQVPESDPATRSGDTGWNTPADPTEVASLMNDWRLDWLDTAQLVTTSDAVFHYPMVDRDPLPHWGTRRVTLLGDAAHPMYPVGANGGSQAILDARALADALALGHGLAGYEARRLPETAAVVHANREMYRSSPDELARVTADYRRKTLADRSSR
ncbi:FAD-dependent monooxygenase [Mycolicibacterium fluoranthenivorans]|uniref:2-polyprenyl-6-methoxyphenol hydroxylase-like FAD-dependent oxidoreductase n=1 Tax=Mycolicibacterium fluoranthenivorans TaxID=258505 RepID=A0A7X5U356_9MYCO|nr:FAD-dependent monooxygenase [Mycolicibacterium fluoranthenivorans]MCV7358601.1 FAD-dependent monooxygenase [Mycolicibacterium fluoranthenivorans]NIH97567.1 2-polyprenyl-6-methoxyphenol hydroxylase-like FAD-dependent oxidoreductase [Mycolicibacterium fluoranthenivorans]